MRVIDLEAHFYTEDYVKYLRKRSDYPREEVMSDGRIKLHLGPGVWAPRSVKLENDLSAKSAMHGLPKWTKPA